MANYELMNDEWLVFYSYSVKKNYALIKCLESWRAFSVVF